MVTDVRSSDVALDAVVDARTGIVTGVSPHPSPAVLPDRLRLWSARVADTSLIGPWWADRVATGMAFDDDTAARNGAIGEALERYCANFVPPGLPRASYHELTAEGHRAVDPSTLALYAEWQHASPGFPFVPFAPSLTVAWMPGTDLTDGKRTWVPASVAAANYFLPPRDTEPPTNFLLYAGLATGRGATHARANAVEELIERDTTAIWWHADGPVIHLEPTASLRAAVASSTDDRLRWTWLWLPNRLGLPVIACLVEDPELGFGLLGVAARPEPEAAARKAAAEAAALWWLGVGLLQPEGEVWEAIEQHHLMDRSPLKAWRADRTYRDAYREDWRDVTDLACQTQLYLDPAMDAFLAPLREPDEVWELASMPTSPDTDLHALVTTIRAVTGHPPVGVDLTTSDVARAGAHVTRVVAPGLYSNAPAAFPLFGGDRLLTEPVTLGWRDRPIRPDQLRTAPLPHT